MDKKGRNNPQRNQNDNSFEQASNEFHGKVQDWVEEGKGT